MELVDYVDTSLAGDSFRSCKLTVPVFVAGYLQETIQSELFRTALRPLQEKIRHLSFLVHLMVRFEDLELAQAEFQEVQSDLARGVASWEDGEYFRSWENKVWGKIFFEGHQPEPVKTDTANIDFVLENKVTEQEEGEEEESEELTEPVSETDFSCGLCHLKTSSREELLLHVKTSHPTEAVSFTQFTKAVARKTVKRKANINTCDICKVNRGRFLLEYLLTESSGDFLPAEAV